jgi:hypothetical protein
MKAAVTVCLIVLGISGCTKSLGTWTKQGMSESQHARDHYACVQEAKYPATVGVRGIVSTSLKIDPSMYGMCMKARGYQEEG